VLGCGVDDFADFGDFGGGEAADFGVAADYFFVFRQVDAERLVGGYEGFYPLDVGGQLLQSAVGCFGGLAELFALQGAYLGDVTFYYESFQLDLLWSSFAVV
jgi:hypothetical protein